MIGLITRWLNWVIKRRPLMLSPFGLWLKPGFWMSAKRYSFMEYFDQFPDGRYQVKVVYWPDMEVWARLTRRQIKRAIRWWNFWSEV